MKKILKPLLIVIVIITLGAFLIKPTLKNISYGIDLQGGFEILYKIEPLEKGKELTEEDLDKTYTAIVNRIDTLGVSEPVIAFEGNNLIRIQLPGVSNEEEARQLAAEIGAMFRLTSAKQQTGVEELFRDLGNKFIDPNFDGNKDAKKRKTIKVKKQEMEEKETEI